MNWINRRDMDFVKPTEIQEDILNCNGNFQLRTKLRTHPLQPHQLKPNHFKPLAKIMQTVPLYVIKFLHWVLSIKTILPLPSLKGTCKKIYKQINKKITITVPCYLPFHHVTLGEHRATDKCYRHRPVIEGQKMGHSKAQHWRRGVHTARILMAGGFQNLGSAF